MAIAAIHLKPMIRVIGSIKISMLALTALASAFCLAENHSESIEIPDSEWLIETQCTTIAKALQCSISVSNDTIEEKVLEYPGTPASASYEAGIFLLTFGCGTECTATYAYKLGGLLGGPFPLVEAADSEREVVMSLSDKSVRFYRMFENDSAPLHEITPDLAGASLLDSVDESSIENHVFRLTYRSENGVEELFFEPPQ